MRWYTMPVKMTSKEKTCFFVLWLAAAVLSSVSGGLTPVCLTSTQIDSIGTPMSLQSQALVNPEALFGYPNNYTVAQDAIYTMGMYSYQNGTIGPNVTIQMTVEEYDYSVRPAQVSINLTVVLDDVNLGATAVTMEISLQNSLTAVWGSGLPPGFFANGFNYIRYNTTLNNTQEVATMEFLIEPGDSLAEGQHVIEAEVLFVSGGIPFATVLPYVCLERVTIVETTTSTEHGYTALGFFVGLIGAILLTLLGVFLFLLIRRKKRDATISPARDQKKKDKGKKIVMDAKAAMKKGNNVIKDFSLMAWDDSIVFVLGMKDKLHMHREIDNLDILSTIHVDTDIEKDQNDASVQASMLLVQGLRHNGDLTRGAEDKANSKLQSQLKDLDKKLEASYRKDLEGIYKDIEAKNKGKLSELMKKHKEERHEMNRVVKDMPEKEKKQMLDLMDQQHQTEENDLTYKLALEQNEKAETLRKEYAIRKRMSIKELQANYIDDVVKEGQLNAQQAEWLIKEHKQQQEEIHRLYDDEISRQRMALEEKLARRKALAQSSETQEDDTTELLNTIAGLQMTFIAKLKKSSTHLSSDELEDYMRQARLDLEKVKSKMDQEEDIRQSDMFKRLSTSKRKILADKIAKHETEFREYMAEHKSKQNEGPVDPVSYVNGLVKMKSRHRKELSALENELDEQHAREFEAMREQVSQEAQDDLKEMERDLIEKLKNEGMEEDQIDKIMKKHDKTVSEIKARQEKDKRNQETRLKDELARRKREWENRRDQERQEQKDLREHETVVVEKLLESQISISESERDRILKEHEKQMVKLENSLTMNKLRQKRMLEEKIAQKRARQMEELQKKQNTEIVKHRRIAENNGEEDDEETHEREVALMKKHAQQKIALIQGQDFNVDNEVEEVRVEMTKERALALKDQEERLGALIASLQMDKAREMAKIDEQQKAINDLKANLMDDLNARGIISTPECERILTIHKEERDKLNTKLDGQRSKQEQMLKAKLAQRLEQREKSMMQKQDAEIDRVLSQVANKSAAKIRQMLLAQKHVVEMEKFRNKLDREVSQSLEDTKRNFEMQKMKIMQEQELQFIAGLVKVGDLTKNELMDVLHMLFPGKTDEAIQDILKKVYDEKTLKRDGSFIQVAEKRQHTGRQNLPDKVQQSNTRT